MTCIIIRLLVRQKKLFVINLENEEINLLGLYLKLQILTPRKLNITVFTHLRFFFFLQNLPLVALINRSSCTGWMVGVAPHHHIPGFGIDMILRSLELYNFAFSLYILWIESHLMERISRLLEQPTRHRPLHLRTT